uniref:Translocator protein n=1 Tax=Dendroctonus ponderosae TaxID=77166 RepID=J3JUF1_DENPD|nr:unknown [Dendroctonus ponderosae]
MSVKINWPAVGAVLLLNVGGITGGLITSKALPWYETLNKPKCRPPNWAFGPVWTSLYCGMGYASYLVYRDGGNFEGAAKIPLMVYGGNLLLNWGWTPIFFGAKRPDLALIEINLLNAAALATGYLFYKVNPTAGYLIVPYCLWLGVATALNFVIWRDNREIKESPKIETVKSE